MSLSAPTTAEVSANILAQIEASLSQSVPLLPKAFIRVLSKALGAVFIIVYRYAGFMLLQQFVVTASARDTEVNGRTVNPLTEWGRLIGVGDPVPATKAELVTRISVTVQSGSIPAGAQLLFPATGVIYLTTASVVLDAATKDVTIRAASDQGGGGGSGAIGNLDPGDVVSFASPVPNVVRDTAIQSTVTTGADAEPIEVYRQRVIDRFQRRPQGGAYSDYRVWGEEVPGIVRVYPYTSPTPGIVDVYVEATEASSGSPDGIPTGAQLTEVYDAIQLDQDGLASRRPVTAAVDTIAISRTAFDVTITGLGAEDLVGSQAAIEAAIDEHLRSRAPYIVGLSVLPRVDRVTQAAVAGVADEAASAVGSTIASVALFLSEATITAYTLDDGELSKLGTVTYLS